MPSGYTSSFAASILYDVAVLYKGDTKFGVSLGGLTFNPESEIRHVEFDGMRSEIEGLHRYVAQGGTIEGEMLFTAEDMTVDLLPGSTSRTSGLPGNVSERIEPKASSSLFNNSDYINDLRMVAARGSEWFEVHFERAYCSTWTWTTLDKNEHKARVMFRAALKASRAVSSTDTPPVYFQVLSAVTS